MDTAAFKKLLAACPYLEQVDVATEFFGLRFVVLIDGAPIDSMCCEDFKLEELGVPPDFRILGPELGDCLGWPSLTPYINARDYSHINSWEGCWPGEFRRCRLLRFVSTWLGRSSETRDHQ